MNRTSPFFCFNCKRALIAVVIAAVASVIALRANFREPKVLGPAEWPTTVQGVVKDILTRLSEKDKATVRNTKLEDLIQFHHTWGMAIRNYYGLWRGNDAVIRDACGRACHPDDVSMLIIVAVWRQLQK